MCPLEPAGNHLPTDEYRRLFNAGNHGQVYLDGKRNGIRVSSYTRARLHRGASLCVGLIAVEAMAAYMARRILDTCQARSALFRR